MQGYNVPKYIEDMQNSLHSLQVFVEAMNIRTKQFGDYVFRTAPNYGLNLIPDDVLSDIFALAAGSLEEKVVLSLVCRRFRAVMMSMRKIWSGHYLEIGQTPEQMVAITEGNRFVSLKAVIWDRDEVRSSASYKAWARNRGHDPKELVDRFYKRSLDFVLSLRLEELRIFELESYGDAQRVLDSVAMQNVRSLFIRDRYNTALRSIERRHTPSLHNLWVDFVPAPIIGRDLIRCKLDRIESDELDSLREFLASANSLRYLALYILERRFYEACDLPSLRSLEVNFAPHPSFARHLTRFKFSWRGPVALKELLDFLSSTELLQTLSIYNDYSVDIEGTTDTHWVNPPIVSLPCLVSCEIHQGCFDFEPGWFRDSTRSVVSLIGRLRVPVLRRLELRFSYADVSIDVSANIGGSIEGIDGHSLDISDVPHGRLIRFEGWWRLTVNIVETLAGYLTDTEGIQIKFYDCRGWMDGTFRRDEIDSARLSLDIDSDESESG